MEQILAFGLTQAQYTLLESAMFTIQIRTKQVSPAFYHRSVKELVLLKPEELKDPTAADLKKSFGYGRVKGTLLLLCDLSDARLDQVLATLRASSLKVDYKAILTPTNQNWNVPKLFAEMEREKAAYTKKV
ncbi:MAG: DUF3783 domain-containing protein [Lachnospiraceae bacterium]|nr:DUF3783 domain-containing protein [Lachnospiraceae bacterium]